MRNYYLELKAKARSKLKTPTWLITAKSATNNSEELRIIFAGNPKNKNHLRTLLTGYQLREKSLGNRWIISLPLFVKKLETRAQIVIVEGGAWTRALLCGQNPFMIPLWINGSIRLDPCLLENTFKRKDIKYELRKIKRGNFNFTISHHIEMLKFFYNRMYHPHLVARYGDCALITSYQEIKQRFVKNQGELLFVKDNSRYVAGMVIIYTSKGPVLDKLAVLDGNPNYLKAGANGALYYFGINYLLQNGHQNLILGGSRAFLNDGVFNYKRKWGMEVFGNYNRFYLLCPMTLDSPVVDFLNKNPFIFFQHGHPCGAIFLDETQPDPEQLTWFKRRYHTKGLSKLVFFAPEYCANRLPEIHTQAVIT